MQEKKKSNKKEIHKGWYVHDSRCGVNDPMKFYKLWNQGRARNIFNENKWKH